MKLNITKILMTILLLFSFFGFKNSSLNEIREEKIEAILVMKLTPVNVYQKILEYEIDEPKIVFSQVMLETGRLKSGGAKIHNNLFGFTKKRGHMIFDSWEESIAYYKNWQDKKYNGGNYYVFLKKVGYAKDSLYISKLMKIEKNLDRVWSGLITF